MSKLREVKRLLKSLERQASAVEKEIILVMQQNGKLYSLKEWEENKRLEEIEDIGNKILINIVEEKASPGV